MVGGRWLVGDGWWEMVGGRWLVGDGRWEMGDGRWEMGPRGVLPNVKLSFEVGRGLVRACGLRLEAGGRHIFAGGVSHRCLAAPG